MAKGVRCSLPVVCVGLFLVLVYVGFWLGVLIYELGHVVARRNVGLSVRSVRVGSSVCRREELFWRFRLWDIEWGLGPWIGKGGLTVGDANSSVLVAAGGVLANLVMLASYLPFSGQLGGFGLALGVADCFVGFSALLPFECHGLHSDGMTLGDILVPHEREWKRIFFRAVLLASALPGLAAAGVGFVVALVRLAK